MIETLYGLDALGTPRAFFLSLLIGFGFGFALERAGFSSSRRLAGVFYFTDMAVVKVMFTALVTAAVGFSYLSAFGLINPDQVFLMPSIYGAQIAGGLLFGIGFAMGAWCPGTAAAGLAAGRIDAFVFLAGTVAGSILFNELFPFIGALYAAGDRGTRLLYDTLGISRNLFTFALAVIAIAAFWLAELAEKARTGAAPYLGTPFLKAFSLAIAAAAAGLFVIAPSGTRPAPRENAAAAEQVIMAGVDLAEDHMEPEELAERMMSGASDLLAVDVRSAEEYGRFHIRGALNIPLQDLAAALQPYKNKGLIVLYSNGMTHPAQARDSLQRNGFNNVFILTDGLEGFRNRCLRPVSLRQEPLPPAAAARVNQWRLYFSGSDFNQPAK